MHRVVKRVFLVFLGLYWGWFSRLQPVSAKSNKPDHANISWGWNSSIPEDSTTLKRIHGLLAANKSKESSSPESKELHYPYPNYGRIQPLTIEPRVEQSLNSKMIFSYSVITYDFDRFVGFLKSIENEVEVIQLKRSTNALHIKCSGKTMGKLINQQEKLIYVSLSQKEPQLESSINYMDLAVNRINTVHNRYPELTGDGVQISIKEQFMDTSDIDLKDRYFTVGLESDIISQHANFMTTLVTGAGNSYHLGRGAAQLATFTSSNFTAVFPDEDEIFKNHQISVQNHSYGFEIDNRYSPEAQAYDHQSYVIPELIHVFSAGNKGNEASREGRYSEIQGFANLSGSQKMSKNALVVGATNRYGERASQSSAGPAYDGRVKPDLMAFGQEGSSDAAALVSGAAVLVQDWYKQNKNQLPTSDLVKAVLIAGAKEYENPVSFRTGYGQLNGLGVMKILESGQFETGAVQKGVSSSFELVLPDHQNKLRLVLCWTDIAGVAGADKALVNDLDIKIKAPDDQEWLPWVLDDNPTVGALSQLPIRGVDSKNNVELITIENPVAGTYTISISTNTEMEVAQNFALAYAMEEVESFYWTFPVGSDICLTSDDLVFRWDGNLEEAGKLEIRNNKGEWVTLADHVEMSDEYFSWTADEEYFQTQLRMTVGSKIYLSDEFNILNETVLEVDYHCEDEFKLLWDRNELATGYELYRLSDEMLVLNQVTADTFLVLSKTSNPVLNYAIRPVYANTSNYRSRTINYTQQGVNCYYKSFTAELIDGSFVENDIILSSIADIESVQFFNWKDGNSRLIASVDEVKEEYSADDTDPWEGVNNYYAQINLKDGRAVQTDTTNIYYTIENTLIIFPNPIAKNHFLNVLTGRPGATLQLLNTQGDLLYEEEVFFDFQEIPISDLSEGIYILRLYDVDGNISSAKLMVAD